MSDAVQMLREQHAELAALFMKLARMVDPRTSAQIFRTIASHLRDHAFIEEAIFYPAIRERARERGREEISTALREHEIVENLLKHLEQASPWDYTSDHNIAPLREAVLRHVREEERILLPYARRLFTESELDDMALRMTQLESIHSPAYQLAGHKTATVLRDTTHAREFAEKVTS